MVGQMREGKTKLGAKNGKAKVATRTKRLKHKGSARADEGRQN